MNSNTKFLKEATVSNYSSRNSSVYDDPMNKNFVYGKLTVDFVNQINFEKEEKIIADIGCGTGFAFEIVYEKLKKNSKKCIGIEPAKGMLELAKNKFKSDSNFSFYEGTFAKVPLKDKSVDKIISTLALHWVPSLEDSIKELKRILKTNGSIDIMMIAKDDGEGFKKPIICLTRGWVIGSAFEILLLSDFVFSHTSSVFKMPEVELSLTPISGGTQTFVNKSKNV